MRDHPEYPLRVFYDGSCVVCAGEIERYLRRDRRGRLIPVDISAPGFDPAPWGHSREELMYQMHAIDREGRVYRGVDAFRGIWLAFPESPVLRGCALLIGLPVVNGLARIAYRAFARIRRYLPQGSRDCSDGMCRIGRRRDG